MTGHVGYAQFNVQDAKTEGQKRDVGARVCAFLFFPLLFSHLLFYAQFKDMSVLELQI